MTSIAVWMEAARPKTLIAAISPVFIGSFLAFLAGSFSLLTALCTLGAALGVQISTNFANDLFDFLKGADTAERKGPRRMTQSGLISPHQMKWGLICLMAISALLGSYLVLLGGVPLATLLIFSLLFAVIYTGGPYPLAYLGLGEIFVFLFFGPIATLGTFYLQTGATSWAVFLAGIGPGLLSTALLVINNLRDLKEDMKSGKKTLPVRFGMRFGKMEYTLLLLLAPLSLLFIAPFPKSLFILLLFLPEAPLLYSVWQREESHGLLLEKTGQLLLVYTLLFFLSYA